MISNPKKLFTIETTTDINSYLDTHVAASIQLTGNLADFTRIWDIQYKDILFKCEGHKSISIFLQKYDK